VCDLPWHHESRHGEREHAPRIEGQHHDYLVKQLKDFQSGKRTNDRGIMTHIAKSLTDADIEDLGNYFAAIRVELHTPNRSQESHLHGAAVERDDRGRSPRHGRRDGRERDEDDSGHRERG